MAAKTKDELLKDVDVRELPATRVSEADMTKEPKLDAAVGDLVAIHSRGSYRIAKVLEATPKRVKVAYTTEGAWRDAEKIHMNAIGLNPEQSAANEAAQAGRNYDYYVGESDAATAKHAVATTWRTEEKAAADRAGYRAKVEAETREEYMARHAAKARERAIKARDKARTQGVTAYVTVTTKSVKRDEVYGLVAAGAVA